MQQQRTSHTATVIDDKLYILGGYGTENEFIYLDVSGPVNTQKLLWNELTNINNITAHYGAASVKGGLNNDTLFLYGGDSSGKDMAPVYTFDPKNNVWSIPKITAGINADITRRKYMNGAIDNNGKMYLWGGIDINSNENVNDMFILDTKNLSWKKGSSVGAPSPRMRYGVTLLPNNNIIYIGGASGDPSSGFSLPLNEVYLYDTVNDNWSTKTTSGKVPSKRNAFSIVLGLDGQSVILFGGTADVKFDNNPLEDSLYVLNLTNFEWDIPKVTGQIPQGRIFHKANVIRKHMVISFGQQSSDGDILLLDISSNDEYKWTNSFDPLPPQPPQPQPPQPPTSSRLPPLPSPTMLKYHELNNSSQKCTTIVIAVTIGSLIILILLGLYLLYKNRLKTRRLSTSLHRIFSNI